MPRTLCPTPTPRCRTLIGAPGPDRPLGFHLLESLLEARAGSMFPTNGAGPDEDVNLYLGHLLGRFLTGDHDPRIQFGAGPLVAPPDRTLPRRARAECYRVNGDHRLLHLGLFDRGDGIRRRATLFGFSDGETRARDLAAGRACYEVAANLLRGRDVVPTGAVAVLDKLARHFDDYVHVLAATATRHLGLGAHLDGMDLARLVPGTTPPVIPASLPADPDGFGVENDSDPVNPLADQMADQMADQVAALLDAPPGPAAMDVLLDLWTEHRKNPGPGTASRLRDMATRLGVSLALD